MKFDLLKNVKLHIDESLLPIVFGEYCDNQRFWLGASNYLHSLAKDIVIFYFGLIQCYYFAKARKDNKISIKELDINQDLLGSIVDIWDVDIVNSFAKDGDIFSYLIEVCKKSDDSALVNDRTKDCIIRARNAYDELIKNSRAFLGEYKNEEFYELLKSLPLLKNTTFSKESLRFTFFNDEEMSIKASPFISFLSYDTNPLGASMDCYTPYCSVLTSVIKGEANDELYFDTKVLNDKKTNSARTRIGREITRNENLKLLCGFVGINTNWYEGWCDLNFLDKMVSATESVLLDYFGLSGLTELEKETTDIAGKLVSIMNDSDFFRTYLLQHENEIYISALNQLLFEQFLEVGLFKTVRHIMLNTENVVDADSKKMFERYLSLFIADGTITQKKAENRRKACQQKIDRAIESLSHIVDSNSNIFSNRKREIEAEWRTSYVLKIAGMKDKSLFADVETILSIDDYYDMLVNKEESPEDDLKRVLRMLCIFYESMIDNTQPLNEKRYFSSVKKIAPKYSNADLSTLFETFIRIAKDLENYDHIESLLGRRGLGERSTDYLELAYQRISEAKESNSSSIYDGCPYRTGNSVFISYCHADVTLVRPIVERWKNLGIGVYFDESDMHAGHNWRYEAENAINHPDCKMFVCFVSKNSVNSEAVLYEVLTASKQKDIKFANDVEKAKRFIVPVVLESDPIDSFLSSKSSNPIAKQMSGLINGDVLSYVISKIGNEVLDKKIRQDYEYMINSDGRIVAPYKFDAYKLAVAKFYAFLKFGDYQNVSIYGIDKFFNNNSIGFERCIYPIVASVKEAKIKRDNIAIAGYELIRGKGRSKSKVSYILTSKTLDVDDYYCIPHYRQQKDRKQKDDDHQKGEKFTSQWIIEPLLIKCDPFIEILNQAREKDNG